MSDLSCSVYVYENGKMSFTVSKELKELLEGYLPRAFVLFYSKGKEVRIEFLPEANEWTCQYDLPQAGECGYMGRPAPK